MEALPDIPTVGEFVPCYEASVWFGLGAPNGTPAEIIDKLRFNLIRDIAPVAAISREPNVVLVNPSVPTRTVPEFIAYAKANPGRVNMASAGNGTTSHLAGELFKMMTGVNMVHVPYRSTTQLTDLLAGQVQVSFPPMVVAIAQVKAGKLRALAVTTATRSEALPDIPAVGEFVPGYEASVWFGLGAPNGTPAEIINMLNQETNAALADQDQSTDS